jgi:predicted flap endonuclease-1-like 5' DNA nuclease
MGKRIEDIEGIGPSIGAALRDAGVNSVDTLLELCCNRNGRASLASKTQISETRILRWVNMADLFRIKGIAGQYAELLEGAGVDTVKELRNRNAENLTTALKAANAEKNMVRKTPSLKLVESWVEQAKSLPPKVTH